MPVALGMRTASMRMGWWRVPGVSGRAQLCAACCPSPPACSKRGVEAYYKKREEMEGAEAGLSSKAERFFVLVQTDNLWKEHLQAIKFLQQAVR